MKKNVIVFVMFTVCCALFTTKSFSQGTAINTSGAAANSSAMLDITSTTQGLLIPRVALSSTTVAAPVTSPAASLMVYNTATAGDVTPGFYYWDGTSKWVRFSTGSGSGSGSSANTLIYTTDGF